MVRESLMLLSVLALAATGSTVKGPSGQSVQASDRSAQAPHPLAENFAPTIEAIVANKRAVGLKTLDLSPAGSPAFKRIVENLGPGRTTLIALPAGGGCVFALHGVYDDGASTNVAGFDFCKNGTIVLFE